jgi:hypothetical protein
VTAPSIRMETVKKVRSTDACGKTKLVANKRESRVTVPRGPEPASEWYSSIFKRWESHNNKRL